MKNFIIFIGVLVILVGAYFLLMPKNDSEQVVYTSDVFTFVSAEDQITIQYDETGDNAELTLNGTKYDLERAVSGSGARYLSADGSVEYWEHQGTAEVKINDETVFEGATLEGDEVRDPSTDTREPLEGTTWQWKETLYNNDDVVTPNDPTEFVLSFMEDGRFSATTDCNNLAGDYEVTDSAISFDEIASTKMACGEDAQEEEFSAMLSDTINYLITGEGELALMIKFDTGSVIFTPVSE